MINPTESYPPNFIPQPQIFFPFSQKPDSVAQSRQVIAVLVAGSRHADLQPSPQFRPSATGIHSAPLHHTLEDFLLTALSLYTPATTYPTLYFALFLLLPLVIAIGNYRIQRLPPPIDIYSGYSEYSQFLSSLCHQCRLMHSAGLGEEWTYCEDMLKWKNIKERSQC